MKGNTMTQFSMIPPSEVHPVTRYGYDPIPGNGGRYWWDEESRTYKPGLKPVGREIVFYRTNFEHVRSIQITHPVPACWSPPEELADCNAIQAVSNGVLVGQASKVYASWHYNLVGGNSHMPEIGATQEDSIKEIVTFFAEAMLLSAAE